MTAKRALRPRQGILDIAPYVPGKSALAGGGPVDQALLQRDAVRPLAPRRRGLSRRRRDPVALPRRLGAALARGDRQALWARPGAHRLRRRLRRAAQPARRRLSRPGDEAIYSRHGFLVYRIAILARGATPVVAPEKDLTADVDAILARVTPATRMVFLANPNNPTGTYLTFDEVKRLRAGLPDERAARARRGLRRICARQRL